MTYVCDRCFKGKPSKMELAPYSISVGGMDSRAEAACAGHLRAALDDFLKRDSRITVQSTGD